MNVKGLISCWMTRLAPWNSLRRKLGNLNQQTTSLIMCSLRLKRNMKILLIKWKVDNKLLLKLTKNLISSVYKIRNLKDKLWNSKNSVAGPKMSIKSYALIWKKLLPKINNLQIRSKAWKSLLKTQKMILINQLWKDSNWERLISTWPMKIKL